MRRLPLAGFVAGFWHLVAFVRDETVIPQAAGICRDRSNRCSFRCCHIPRRSRLSVKIHLLKHIDRQQHREASAAELLRDSLSRFSPTSPL